MAFARDTYVATASQTDFVITYPYLAETDVIVYQNGSVVSTDDYIFATAALIRLDTGATVGDAVTLQRNTTQATRRVDFTAGPVVEADLDNSALQLFYMSQESLDRANISIGSDTALIWDAEDIRIKDVGTPTLGGDAVNKTYADSLVGAAVVAEEHTATASQTVFTLTGMTYTPGVNNLTVFINGVHQASGAYTETSATVVTFSSGLTVGDLVVFHSAEILTTTTSQASVSVYTPDGTGAVDTNVQAKLRERVSVKDFGATGDGVTDDTAAVQAALDSAGATRVLFPSGYTFKLVGEVTIPSNMTLEFQSCTVNWTLDGENGRGFHFSECSNSSMVGKATITGDSTTLGTDGSRNSIVHFGHSGYVTVDPTITQHCKIDGDFNISSIGSANVKLVGGFGYIEDCLVRGVRCGGQSNYAIAFHWAGNGSSGVLPTKTWHPHNITIEDCVVDDTAYAGDTLRAYTVSACGTVHINKCYSNVQTLSYNLFVGDYGYTYAQNITALQAFQYWLSDVEAYGAGSSFSADALSAGVNSSAVWDGTAAGNNAVVRIHKAYIDATTHANGLTMGFTSVNKLVVSEMELYSSSTTHTREFFYPQLCGKVSVSDSVFYHNEYMRIRTTDEFTMVNSKIYKPVNTPDVTSYTLTLTGVTNSTLDGCHFSGARTCIYSVDNVVKNITVTNCLFTEIGAQCIDLNYTNQLIITNNQFTDVGTTTTSTTIYAVTIDVTVAGFLFSGNVFGVNSYKYLLFTSATTSNGVITNNLFLDLNEAVTTAAVYLNVGATNVYVDPKSNIVATGFNLVTPGTIPSLLNNATPTVLNQGTVLTGGTTTITDFDDGVQGQTITILSGHAVTITDGTNIFLSGSANFVMASTDSLVLIQKADGKWYEISRSVN